MRITKIIAACLLCSSSFAADSTPIGVVWSDNFERASLGANWTIISSADVTIESSTALKSVAASQVPAACATYKYYTSCDQWTLSWEQWWNTLDATSYGALVGLHNEQTKGGYDRGYTAHLIGAGTDLKKLSIVRDTGSSYVTLATSSGAMTFSTGDHIAMTFTRSNNVFYASASNTVDSSSITVSYATGYSFSPYVPTISRFAVYPVQGTVYLDNMTFTINAFKPASFVMIGDSISEGSLATSSATRFVGVIQSSMTRKFNSISSGWNRTLDAENLIPEITAFEPVNAVLMIGGNDVLAGNDYTGHYSNLVTSLQSMGTHVIHCLPTPRTGLDESGLKNWIIANYPSADIIDTWTPLLGSGTDINDIYSPDGTHPNDAGHAILAATILGGLPAVATASPFRIGGWVKGGP